MELGGLLYRVGVVWQKNVPEMGIGSPSSDFISLARDAQMDVSATFQMNSAELKAWWSSFGRFPYVWMFIYYASSVTSPISGAFSGNPSGFISRLINETSQPSKKSYRILPWECLGGFIPKI